MKIAVFGSGNVGSALAVALKKSGHEVFFGTRNQEHYKGQSKAGGVQAYSIKDAAAMAEVWVVATPPEAIEALMELWPSPEHRTIIDSTNSIRSRPEPHTTVYHALLNRYPGAGIVKCFNSTGFENMMNPVYGDMHLDMFMAGDHGDAKQIAKKLALDAGFEECWDFGGSDKVLLLEQFALAWINLAIMQGHGRNLGMKVLRR
jgi:predicted dinucleotide-binding enzyme